MKTLLALLFVGVFLSYTPVTLANVGEVTGTEEASDTATQAGSPECDGNCGAHMNSDILTENANAANQRAKASVRTGSQNQEDGDSKVTD